MNEENYSLGDTYIGWLQGVISSEESWRRFGVGLDLPPLEERALFLD